jgi:hypothetical protein
MTNTTPKTPTTDPTPAPALPAPRTVRCEQCGEPIEADRSAGVWLHDANQLADRAYDLNEQHAARPPEGTSHPAE